MVSTKADIANLGKLIDNHSKVRPVYFVEDDLKNKNTVKYVFKDLFKQNPALKNLTFTFTPTQIYEVKKVSWEIGLGRERFGKEKQNNFW